MLYKFNKKPKEMKGDWVKGLRHEIFFFSQTKSANILFAVDRHCFLFDPLKIRIIQN